MLLMNIIPVSTCDATRLPRAISLVLVNTEPPKPKSESLASAIAAASSFTRKNMATGPKNSSRNAGLSGFTSVRMVASMNEPARSIRLPPNATFAPFATALSTCLSKSTSADSVDKGPCVVFSSIGSPGFSASSAVLNFARN